MIQKITKAVWFFSLLICFAVLMYVYASVPETISILQGEEAVSLSRDTFFYLALAIITIMNLLVFVVNKIYPESAVEFKSWFYGLVVTLNIFFVIGLSFVSLINSGEKFDFPRIGVVIYGSVGLIVVWALAWPVYSLSKSFLRK